MHRVRSKLLRAAAQYVNHPTEAVERKPEPLVRFGPYLPRLDKRQVSGACRGLAVALS